MFKRDLWPALCGEDVSEMPDEILIEDTSEPEW